VSIEFRCTGCNRLLRTGDNTAAKQAKCPECGTIVTIPAGQTPPSPAAAPGSAPPPFASPQAENPYRSPDTAVPSFGPMPTAPANLRAYALDRVSGPGIALIVMGALGVPIAVIASVVNIVNLNAGVPPVPDPAMGEFFGEFQSGMMIGQVFGSVIGIGVSILLIVGGVKMKNLRSYGLCMAAAILAAIPCFSSCCCLEVPFGIWALVVLADKQVSAAFTP